MKREEGVMGMKKSCLADMILFWASAFCNVYCLQMTNVNVCVMKELYLNAGGIGPVSF